MKTYQDLIFGKCTIGAHADIYPDGDENPGERWAFISTHDTRKKAREVAEDFHGCRVIGYLNGHYKRGWTVLKFCKYVPPKPPKPQPTAPQPSRPFLAEQLELFTA